MDYTETQVREILAHPESHEWTIQGFGMLRTWLDPEGNNRLHIWDIETAYENTPSTVHTHPWDFQSRIYFGHLQNQRYTRDEYGNPYKWAEILTGRGGGLISGENTITLSADNPEEYEPGGKYFQYAEEIHESYPAAGTVTVIQRRFLHNRHATVFWSANSEWATAEPRLATETEVRHFLSLVKI